jgi:hypothetical protein
VNSGADGNYSIARQVLRKTLAALVYNFDMQLWDAKKDKAEGYRYLNTYPRKGHEGFLYLSLKPRFRSADGQLYDSVSLGGRA